jgi:3-oxoacyl-[acyl-carrier protein] reductase
MDLGLTDRVALVSGASGEIGQAICAVLLDEGAIVAALHRGTGDRLTSLRERAGSGGSEQKIVPVVAELTDGTAIDTAMQQVLDRCGRIDILVNNAAVTIEGPFLAVPESEARELAEVNVWAAYRLMQLALKPMMRARRGVVVNVSSVVASYGGRGVSAYAMTKAALETLTRVLALDGAKGRAAERRRARSRYDIDEPRATPAPGRGAVGEDPAGPRRRARGGGARSRMARVRPYGRLHDGASHHNRRRLQPVNIRQRGGVPMQVDDVFPMVRAAVSTCCGAASDSIRLESRLVDDLGMQSLDFVELIYEVEQAFDITVPMSNLERQIQEAMGGEAFELDGILTPAGRERLQEMVAGLAGIEPGVDLGIYEIPRLLTVYSVCDLILREKARAVHGSA